jgi:hypothetical protein
MKETLRLAMQPSVVKRALKYAIVVGMVLITINHSDAILKGQVGPDRIFKMALTVMVPYIVSTLSSVGALRDKMARAEDCKKTEARLKRAYHLPAEIARHNPGSAGVSPTRGLISGLKQCRRDASAPRKLWEFTFMADHSILSLSAKLYERQ